MKEIRKRLGVFITPEELKEISEIKTRFDMHRDYARDLSIEDGEVPIPLTMELTNLVLELINKIDQLSTKYGFSINVDIDSQSGEFIIYGEETM